MRRAWPSASIHFMSRTLATLTVSSATTYSHPRLVARPLWSCAGAATPFNSSSSPREALPSDRDGEARVARQLVGRRAGEPLLALHLELERAERRACLERLLLEAVGLLLEPPLGARAALTRSHAEVAQRDRLRVGVVEPHGDRVDVRFLVVVGGERQHQLGAQLARL